MAGEDLEEGGRKDGFKSPPWMGHSAGSPAQYQECGLGTCPTDELWDLDLVP